MDACCLRDSDGRLCVAAAAEWAVSLWSRPSPSGAWTRRHTWHFTEVSASRVKVVVRFRAGRFTMRGGVLFSANNRSRVLNATLFFLALQLTISFFIDSSVDCFFLIYPEVSNSTLE